MSNFRTLKAFSASDKPNAGQILVQNSSISAEPFDLSRGLDVQRGSFIGAGLIVSCGEGVTNFAAGDRVIYISRDPMLISSHALLHAKDAIKLQAGMNEKEIVASLGKVISAQILTHNVFSVREGTNIAIFDAHSSASKALAVYAKNHGASSIIGIVDDASTDGQGYFTNMISSQKNDWQADVISATKGNGVHCAYIYDGASANKVVNIMSLGGIIVMLEGRDDKVQIDIDKLRSRSLFFTAPSIQHYQSGVKLPRMQIIDVIEGIADGVLKLGYEEFSYSPDNVQKAFQNIIDGKSKKGVIIVFDAN